MPGGGSWPPPPTTSAGDGGGELAAPASPTKATATQTDFPDPAVLAESLPMLIELRDDVIDRADNDDDDDDDDDERRRQLEPPRSDFTILYRTKRLAFS